MATTTIPPTFVWPVQFLLFNIVWTYVVSVVTGNLSQVDRVWTFLPTIYTAYFALLPYWPKQPALPLLPFTPVEVHPYLSESYSPRALTMLTLIVMWMLRLSYNTFRRGLFSFFDEDYRWPVLRAKLHPVLLQIVNLTFIACIQNVLLMFLGLPAHAAALQPHTALTTSDYILSGAAILVLLTEFTADNQQNSYQNFKHGKHEKPWIGADLKWTEADKHRGFVTRGLWAWSRHPNFFCEQTFWTIITLFPILSSDRTPSPPFLPSSILTPLYPLLPALCLNALFYASTLFSESISSGKYPAYSSYKKRVAMFFPPATLARGIIYGALGSKGKLDADVWGAVTANKSVQKKKN